MESEGGSTGLDKGSSLVFFKMLRRGVSENVDPDEVDSEEVAVAKEAKLRKVTGRVTLVPTQITEYAKGKGQIEVGDWSSDTSPDPKDLKTHTTVQN